MEQERRSARRMMGPAAFHAPRIGTQARPPTVPVVMPVSTTAAAAGGDTNTGCWRSEGPGPEAKPLRREGVRQLAVRLATEP